MRADLFEISHATQICANVFSEELSRFSKILMLAQNVLGKLVAD